MTNYHPNIPKDSDLSKLLKESLLNNSYDYDSMDKALIKTWKTSFSYLYAKQKALIGYEELFYYSNDEISHNNEHIGDLYLDKQVRACFDIDYDIINVIDREEFRTSRFYMTWFTPQDIANNPLIFKKMPLIIIDDCVVWDYEIFVDKDSTTFKLPFGRDFVIKKERNLTTTDPSRYDQFIYIDHKIQALVIENEFFYTFKSNRVGIHYDAQNSKITINKKDLRTSIDAYIDDTIKKENQINFGVNSPDELLVDPAYPSSATKADITYEKDQRNALYRRCLNAQISYKENLRPAYNFPIKTGIMFGSLHFTNIDVLKEQTPLHYYINPKRLTVRMEPMGTQLIEFTETETTYEAKVTKDIADKIAKAQNEIDVSFVFISRLVHHTMYNGDKVNTATIHEKDDDKNKPKAEIMVLTRDEYPNIPYENDNKYTCYPEIGNNYRDDTFKVPEDNLIHDPYPEPIPTENFMIFKKKANEDGYVLLHNTDAVELHYPNLYMIKDDSIESGDTYEVYYFYHRDYDDLHYTCIFDFYYYYLYKIFGSYNVERFFNDVYFNTANLSHYNTDAKANFKEVFNKLFITNGGYHYKDHQLGEIDFLHRYIKLPGNENKTPVEYKDATMKDWERVHPWLLRDYVLDQKKLGTSYHLFVNASDIDLPSRLRTDTSLEFGETFKDTFDEERYVFALANEEDYPILLNCRVFVDGLMVGEIFEKRKNFMEYLYIPKDMVSATSYIEVEIFPSYSFKKSVEFTSLDQKETITLVEPVRNDIWPTMADVYYQHNEEEEIHKIRYDPRLFDYTVHYKDADYNYGDLDFTFDSEYPDNKPVKFTRIKKITVQPNDERVLNTPLWFTITKKTNQIRFRMARNGYPFIEIFDHDFQFSTDYIRIFVNGRLIPRTHYRLLTTYTRPRIVFMEWMHINDIIYVDITPYRYTQIYYKDQLEEGQTLLDLRGVIDKPFDIRYYDVYVNGRKMSVNSVFAITPWEITFVNLKSIYNIEIYEKERDWEYFGLDYKENIYTFTLDDLFDKAKGLVTEDEKNDIIKDIINNTKDERLVINPNENNEEKQRHENDEIIYAIYHIFYFDELIPKTFVNPDRLQFSDFVMQDNYMEVYQNYKRLSKDATVTDSEKARKENYPGVIELDPDIMVHSPTKKPHDPVNFIFTDSNVKGDGDMSVDVYDIRDLSPYLDTTKLDPNLTYYIVPIFDGFQIVYCVGHIDENVDQVLLDQSSDLEIPEIGDINTYKGR